jgi:hypothetical protein
MMNVLSSVFSRETVHRLISRGVRLCAFLSSSYTYLLDIFMSCLETSCRAEYQVLVLLTDVKSLFQRF